MRFEIKAYTRLVDIIPVRCWCNRGHVGGADETIGANYPSFIIPTPLSPFRRPSLEISGEFHAIRAVVDRLLLDLRLGSVENFHILF